MKKRKEVKSTEGKKEEQIKGNKGRKRRMEWKSTVQSITEKKKKEKEQGRRERRKRDECKKKKDRKIVAQQWWDSISLLGWADITVPETLLLLSGHQAESAAWACYLSKSLNPTPVPPIALMIHTGDSPHCAPECSLLCSHSHWLRCHCVIVWVCVLIHKALLSWSLAKRPRAHRRPSS